ncbi:lipopolysaccharide biosynthesis protein [Sphingobacterium endophyticum]|uniref:lipopolysaccharide biosynthesis protein n=1 Tax=Sphingobacterium endophyticum TaxID=2546448 RepID=UPI001E283C1A|nr:polysaccharide biosynthesis C-terminal domain-containing protein [Sphingobacterium endophyticum]
MSVVKKFVSDTMIYGLSTIISRMLNFVLTPFFTSKFIPSVYGVFTSLFSYSSMVNAVLAFGMETTYFRYLQKVEGDKQRVFDSSFLVTLVTAALFLISIFTFTEPIAIWLNEGVNVQDYVEYVKYFGLILAADAIAVVPFAKLRAEGRPIKYGAIKLINVLVFIFANLFLLVWLPELMKGSEFIRSLCSGWFREGWLGNVFISNAIASILTLFLLLPQILSFRFKVDSKLVKDMLSYSFPILIANISFIINENLDKVLIPRLLPGEKGDYDTGIYGGVAKIAVFLNLFVTAFRLGAEPFFFSYSKNENARKTYAVIMEYFVIAMIMVMIGLCANLDWLKHFINEKYWSGLILVPMLLFNYVLLGIYMNLSVWYKLSDQTRYGLYISGIGAIITIILNFALIPHFSYFGAALSTTVTYLFMVGLSYFWGQQNYSIPYKNKKIGIYLIIGLAVSWAAYFGHFWIGNLLFLLFLGAVFYFEKESLLRILKRGGSK